MPPEHTNCSIVKRWATTSPGCMGASASSRSDAPRRRARSPGDGSLKERGDRRHDRPAARRRTVVEVSFGRLLARADTQRDQPEELSTRPDHLDRAAVVAAGEVAQIEGEEIRLPTNALGHLGRE